MLVLIKGNTHHHLKNCIHNVEHLSLGNISIIVHTSKSVVFSRYSLAAVIVSGSGFLVLGLGHGLVHSLVHAQVMVVISKALLGKAVLLSSPSRNRSCSLLLET